MGSGIYDLDGSALRFLLQPFADFWEAALMAASPARTRATLCSRTASYL